MAVPARQPGDDGALVLAVQQGDAEAFDALFRRHYPAVRRACFRRLFDPVEADEVAQAAFVRAFERIDQCGGDRRFGPWVHVIARSLCVDAFRAQARVQPCEEPLAGRGEHRPNEPEESVLSRERAAHVHEALAALPERQRSAVIARDWEELRPGEIADQLGLSVGAVDSLLLRARRRLALSYRRLAGEGGGGASTRTLRAAAASAAAMLAVGPHALLSGGAAAAAAVQDTASRAAGGVVTAVVSVAITLGATPPAPAAPSPLPDAPVVVTTMVPDPPARAGAPTRSAPPERRPDPATGALPAPGPTPAPAPVPDAGTPPPPAPPATTDPTATEVGARPGGPTPTAPPVPTTTTVPAAVTVAVPSVKAEVTSPLASVPALPTTLPTVVDAATRDIPTVPVTTPTIPSLRLDLDPARP